MLKKLISRKYRAYFLSIISITYLIMMFIIWNVNIHEILSINASIHRIANQVLIIAAVVNIDIVLKEKSLKQILLFVVVMFLLLNNANHAFHGERAKSLINNIIPVFLVYLVIYSHEQKRLFKYGFHILIGLFLFYNIVGIIGALFKFEEFLFSIPNFLVDNYRYSSILTNPNSWGEFAFIGIWIATLFLLKTNNNKLKVFYVLVIISGLGALFFSMARTSILMLGVLYVGLLAISKLVNPTFRKYLYILFGLFVVGIIGLALYNFNFFLDLFRLNQGLNERDLVWQYASQYINESLWYGIGFGNGPMYMAISETFSVTSVHNLYLALLLELGLLVFIIIMLYFVYKLVQMIYYSRFTKEHRIDLILYTLFIVAFLVGQVFEDSFFKVGPVNLFIFIMFSIINNTIRVVKNEGIYIKKVTHLITGLDSGGAESMLYKIMINADSNLYKIKVISLDSKGFYGQRLEDAGIKVVALNMRSPISIVLGMFRLIYHLFGTDTLQTWLYHANFLGIIFGKLLLIENIIWGVRQADISIDHNKKSTVMIARASKYLSWMTDTILSNSEEVTSSHIELGYNKHRFKTIYNGFDITNYNFNKELREITRTDLGLSDELVFINVARYDIQKDHDTLFASLSSLKNDNISFKLILCGMQMDRSNNELIEKLNKYDLVQETILLGVRTDVASLLNAADYFLLSSLGEGFPNVLGEAMAVGLIPVVTEAGDCKMIVSNAGKVVPIQDPNSFYKAIKEVLNLNEEEKQKLRTLARTRIVENFDIIKITKKYEELY